MRMRFPAFLSTLLMVMIAALLLALAILVRNNVFRLEVSAEERVSGGGRWNRQPVQDISRFSMVPDGVEYKLKKFNPPIFERGDGAPFLTVALVDDADWINLALNSFITLKKYQDPKTITIVTVDDKALSTIFRRLGFYVYDVGPIVKTYPRPFRGNIALPYWSWGEIIFTRFNMWVESFRREIGFCSLDLDVTYAHNALYGKINGTYADISMQGNPFAPDPLLGKPGCEYAYRQNFQDAIGHYVNPGLACHSYNTRTASFLHGLAEYNEVVIKAKRFGWGQVSYAKMFCDNEFTFQDADPLRNGSWQWHGMLKQTNVTVSLFKAASSEKEYEFPRPGDGPNIPCFHAKACHGAEKGSNATARVRCKEDWLKQQNQWFLPDGLPTDLKGWLHMSDETVDRLQRLLFF